MQSNEMNAGVKRRRFFRSAASAALLGANGLTLSGQTPAPSAAGSSASSLLELATLRNYQTRKSSSFDRTGGNADFAKIAVGQTIPLMEVNGPGTITHIWFTINSREEHHLKKLVLRAYWDGETEPSVEVPVGDFFGLGLGEYFLYQSALTSVAAVKALNAYFPMPFAKTARLTVTNEGQRPTDSFYYNIDYVVLPELPANVGYFHAQYRQATPCRGWTDDWAMGNFKVVDQKKNLNGEGNYVFLEAQGRGHFIGVTHSVLQNQDGWFGEGDEMIFIDDNSKPAITGTGTEDYYNGAWDFGGINGAQPFAYRHIGAPYITNAERIGGRYSLYRWHVESPVVFEKSLKVTIEHGHANHRSDNFFSTAYWYQTEPHAKFPVFPKVEDRIPKLFRVGGAGAAPVPDQS
jgi:hypothetical protein